jgi:hypothetical protein
MAFHPFKHFRKRQKIYLAGLTILTMIIFVAQFGAGDPFTRLQQWIGMTVHHGDPLLELYGKKIYSEDLDKLRWRRQMASEFVFFNASEVVHPLQKTLSDIQKKYGDPKTKSDRPGPVSTALEQMNNAFTQANGSLPEDRQKPLLDAIAFIIHRQLSNPEVQNSAEQYRALDAIATELSIRCWASDPQRRPDDFYFGGRASRPEDQLDFLVWKHQADRLGIELTQADVCREINRAWGNGDFLSPKGKFDNEAYVLAFFHTNKKFHTSLSPRDLLSALTDEFRVALAKQALRGVSSGVRSYREMVDGIHRTPSAATPDEFYKYFQEQRTTLSLTILPIAVKSFVDKVEAKPTETDLVNLFERYKNDEPSPTRRQPGFKEPRRVKMAYFSYRPEGPFARKLAAKATELLPLFRVAQLACPAVGAGPGWAASVINYPDVDTFVLSLYEDYRQEESRRVTVKYDRDDHTIRFGLPHDLLNPQVVEAQAATAALGELLGGAANRGTPLGALIGWQAANEMGQRATLTAYASAVLGGGGSSPLAAVTLPMRFRHTLQPLDAVRQQLIERFQNTLAQKMMKTHVDKLRKELDKVLATHSEEKLKEFLKKAESDSEIENVHIMETAQTRQELLDRPDPGLKDLREAYEQSFENPFAQFMMNTPRPDFVSALFHSFERSAQEIELDRMFQQERPIRSREVRSRGNDTIWVFWRVMDQPARVRRFQDVREQVKDAWYLEQARKLAREKAKQINDELKAKNLAPDPARQFLIGQNMGTVFDLNNVAHLIGPEFSLPGGAKIIAGDYRSYQPPKEFIPYPPADFVDQLLKLKKRGESTVIADQGVRHFYIAVLREDPRPPDMKEFQEAYKLQNTANAGISRQEPLWDKMMVDRQRQYARQLLEQLRTEATKSLENGEYVLPETARNRGDSSDSGE